MIEQDDLPDPQYALDHLRITMGESWKYSNIWKSWYEHLNEHQWHVIRQDNPVESEYIRTD